MSKLRVVVWNEFKHEQENDLVRSIYPDGIHQCIAEMLAASEHLEVTTATLQEPEHGLTEERLGKTDVLIWWGHKAHREVDDEIVRRVQARVWEGMGLVVLHSGHFSKIFRALMGTACALKWREAGEKERLWVCNPGHAIAAGLPPCFELENEEMYGEPFSVPPAEETVFISWFEGGEVFRSGLCYHRGNGKIFYFRPGHETYPTYKDANVQRVIRNAVDWAAPQGHWENAAKAANVPVDKAAEKIELKGGSVH